MALKLLVNVPAEMNDDPENKRLPVSLCAKQFMYTPFKIMQMANFYFLT